MEQQKTESISSFKKMSAHPRFVHFVLYSVSYLLYGQLFTALGPMFPYLAAHQGKTQTQYSILFSTRGFGFIFGSVIVKLIGSNKITLHQLIGLGTILMSLFSIMFNQFEDLFIKGICIFISSIGCSFLDISINIAALQCFKGENVSVWLQVIHGGFGIGGLLGPFAVYLFQLSSLTVLGFIQLITLFFYWYLETPQKVNTQNQQVEQQNSIPIPNISIYLISLCFFFVVGQEVSYGGWISSYAVLYKFSTKQHATFYSSLYWISITFFRFALAAVSGKPSFKIIILCIMSVITSVISYFFIFYVNSQFGLIFMSLLFGICDSVLYPLLLVVPQEFGYKLTVKEGTTFVMFGSLGQGLLAIFVGKMMGWFSYDWLIYAICIMNVSILFAIKFNSQFMIKRQVKTANRNQRMAEKSLQMKLIEK